MPLFLSESDVASLLTVPDAIRVLEEAIREQGEGRATNAPRQRVTAGRTTLHVLPAAVPSAGSLGLKAYTTGPGGARFWLLLFGDGGELLAFMEADRLGQARTGAASGVATRHLSRAESSGVGVIGTGYQARTQLEAVCAVREITRVRAWSRTRENAERYCREMSARLGIPVEPADTAQGAVEGADIVITMTNAREPVLRGEWLAEGAHLNVAGSNRATHREVDAATFGGADLIVTDDLDQARVESGDLIEAVAEGAVRWEDVHELDQVVAGKTPGRRSTADRTVFKSHGVGLWDVAVAAHVYRAARERGVGRELGIGAG